MGDKVLIAMSGGVDSSAAALLLKRRGYDCAGCTMRLYENADIGADCRRTCCSLEDVEDARAAALSFLRSNSALSEKYAGMMKDWRTIKAIKAYGRRS